MLSKTWNNLVGSIPWNEEILPAQLIYLLANVGENMAQQQKHAHLAGLGMQPAISQMQKPVDFRIRCICGRTQNLTLYLSYYSVHNQHIVMKKNPVLKRHLNWDHPLRDMKATLPCNKSWFLFINLHCLSFFFLWCSGHFDDQQPEQVEAVVKLVNLRKSIRAAVNTGSNHPTTYTAGWTWCLLIALTLFLHV